jgi:hypothetical protein
LNNLHPRGIVFEFHRVKIQRGPDSGIPAIIPAGKSAIIPADRSTSLQQAENTGNKKKKNETPDV